MKKHLCFILFILLFSCKNKTNLEIKIPDDFVFYYNEINNIYIYSIDRSNYFIFDDFEYWSLYTEDEIRQNGNIFIFNKYISPNQVQIISFLLYSAKEVIIDSSKNIPHKFFKNGLNWIKDSGFVIDIYDLDGEILKTYIMQNGLDVFFEKGRENIYYEVPESLLNSFYISEQAFISDYKKIIKN